MIYSMTPVNIQRSYEQAQRDERKAADYPFGDPQIKELAKGQMEEANLLAAIYNIVVKGNETDQKKLETLQTTQQQLVQAVKFLTSPDFVTAIAQALQQPATRPAAAFPNTSFLPNAPHRLIDVNA